jgi:NAD(P)-dependent dehydrogenase (short-subunit alcohol dehydrogenase family)
MSTPRLGVALVTGSSRGIGRAIAIYLARAGFDIALNNWEAGAELDQAAALVEAEGAKVVKIVTDVADLGGHAAMLDQLEAALGPVTTLINNAGVSVLNRGDVLDVAEDSYDRCMTINTKAMFFLSQAFARRVLSRPRREDQHYNLINITSSNAVSVAVNRAEYCASKAAAAMISKVFATRLAGEGIQVFDIQPGLIETDMSRPAKESYERRIREDGLTLIPRMGQPDDIGKMVATLATGGLPYTAGQVISADAGLLIPRF